VKMMLPKVLGSIGARAAQIHGSLGVSDEMPFVDMVTSALSLGVADGPTEVHKVTVAREVLRDVRPATGLFPSYHLPAERDRARAKYREVLERHGRWM
jgi:acyl-CoA dehydrogenase